MDSHNKKIVLAGGTGFIGAHLTKHFNRLGYQVVIISRWPPYVRWDDEGALINALENASLLINLAGKSVDCRYDPKNKEDILLSRTLTTKRLGEILQTCTHPPELWINLSTATIYRHAEDRGMTEEQGELGEGFSVEVAKQWEGMFFSFVLPNTRQAALRSAVVVGRNGSAVQSYSGLVRYGLGGIQGNGRQMFSWVHMDDLTQIIQFIQSNPEMKGIYNCSSPNPVTNKQLMQTLRKILKVRFALPTPAWLLDLGAKLIQTEPELVLKSRWVLPERLLQKGYIFKYTDIEQALKAVV